MRGSNSLEASFVSGLVSGNDFFARLLKPPGKALDPGAQLFQANDEQNLSIESIDLVDYLQRTLPTAIEYVFAVELSNRPRNFSLWNQEQWITFFRSLMDLYHTLITSTFGEEKLNSIGENLESQPSVCGGVFLENIPRHDQTIYSVIHDLLPGAMYAALEHAVNNNIIKPYLLSIDVDQLSSQELSTDEKLELINIASDQTQLLSSLKQKIATSLERGFTLIGGEVGFVDRVMVGLFYRMSNKGSVHKDLTANKELARRNETIAQIGVALKLLARKITSFGELDIPTYYIKEVISAFVRKNPETVDYFLLHEGWWVNALEENNLEMATQLKNGIVSFQRACVEVINQWPIYIDYLSVKGRVVGGLHMLLINTLSYANKLSDGRVDINEFLQAIDQICENDDLLWKTVVEGGWMHE